MDKKHMLAALALLDKKLKTAAKLLLGGGGAMVLAHGFPLATMDLDALFYKSQISEADVFTEIQAVAAELMLPKDWLNPYFGSFLYTLPKDYEVRLTTVFRGKHLTVNALGLEDLLILKSFAAREKDIPHARALINKILSSRKNTNLVENHINALIDLNIPKANNAKDFLDDLLDELLEK